MILATILYLLTVAGLYAGWAAALVWVLRWLWAPFDYEKQMDGLPPLDWADLAFLQEGTRRVFTSAIVWYVQNGRDEHEPKASRLTPLRPLS